MGQNIGKLCMPSLVDMAEKINYVYIYVWISMLLCKWLYVGPASFVKRLPHATSNSATLLDCPS